MSPTGTLSGRQRAIGIAALIAAAGALPSLARTHTTLQFSDATLQNISGRICNAGIAVTFAFQIEQCSAMICAINRVTHGLVNRYGHGFVVLLRSIACMNSNGFSSHPVPF